MMDNGSGLCEQQESEPSNCLETHFVGLIIRCEQQGSFGMK